MEFTRPVLLIYIFFQVAFCNFPLPLSLVPCARLNNSTGFGKIRRKPMELARTEIIIH
jgi:hypothetical protein